MFDIGPFARVATWDPGRTYGALATRLVRTFAEEFRAEDIYTERDLVPDEAGRYTVPVDEHGRGCIGLQWMERRPVARIELEFADPAAVPLTIGVQVQRWDEHEKVPYPVDHGTPWQGDWVTLPGKIEEEGTVWRFEVDPEQFPEDQIDIRKIRWTFPPTSHPIVVKRLAAFIATPLAETEVSVALERPLAGRTGEIEAYNAEWIDPAAPAKSHVRTWDLGAPMRLKLRAPAGDDRTGLDKLSSGRLWVRLPTGDFAVALDDLVREGRIYVPAHGFYAAVAPDPIGLAAHKKSLEGRKTVLERVREMPDQTRETAWNAVFDPALRTSPTMLSLANDNRKCVVQRTGETEWLTLAIKPDLFANRVHYEQRDTPLVLGKNTAPHAEGETGDALRIGDTTYDRGLGLHAKGELRIRLDGEYERFRAVAGLQWTGGQGPGSVTLDIEVDGESRFSSGLLTETDAPRTIDVPLSGARELTLRIGDGGDGITCDMVVLADAGFQRAGGPDFEHLDEILSDDGGEELERHLDGDWLPAPVIERRRGSLASVQRTYVVPFDNSGLESDPLGVCEKPLAVMEFRLENRGDRPVPVTPKVIFSITKQRPGFAELQVPGDFVAHTELRTVPEGVIVCEGDTLRAFVAIHDDSLQVETAPGELRFSGELPASSAARFTVYVPEWDVSPDSYAELAKPDAFDALSRYWERIFSDSLQVDLPDPFLNDLIRASQVHCMLATWNEDDGAKLVPHIASIYPPLESEANAIIRAMYFFGHEDYARRAFDYYIGNYTEAGYLQTVYTLVSTGWHLQTVAEFHRFAPDRAWLERHASELARAARWIVGERAKTMQVPGDGPKPPEYGLASPYNLADWGAYAYYFAGNGYFYAGLKGAAELLKQAGHPEAEAFEREAADFRRSILDAFRWSQGRTPVRPLLNGAWVPASPSQVHVHGSTIDYFFTSDSGRCQAYDVELGSHHLIPQGVIDLAAPEVSYILDSLEDIEFLTEGFLAYPAEKTRRDWFNLGGFGRLQPYYCRNAEIYALLDDVKPFIRAYFNTFPSLVNPEDLSFWEHFAAHGAWNKTHETAYFLHQTRVMLVNERGNELWLAPLITDRWLEDGKTISVTNAPTLFGTVSYRIESHIADGHIDAEIDASALKGVEALVLRLRHPEGRSVRQITVNGRPHTAYDPEEQTLRLATPPTGQITIRVTYE